MRTRRRLTPPADANELLDGIRAGRLLSRKQIRRLVFQWSESRPDEPDDATAGTRLRADELVDAGLMTRWQVAQLLAGHGRRLRLGPYRLLEWLGAGGMGRVYKAEHRLMKRVVALKVLGGPTRTADARWRREVEAAARLSHPNIVAAYDAVRAHGVLFLVMEYVEGIDLARLVARAGPLPVPLACEAVRQTALALQYAHERALLHCDVKPSNLLLVHPPRPRWDAAALAEWSDGRRPVLVKLLDLGLARGLRGDGPGDEHLEGTPDYLAPERAAGGPIDGRSDLYSLGCTFYHLLTGQPPFPGGDWADKVRRHRLETPPPVRELRPDLPAAAAAVVERLMARDAHDRYATAAEAAADLETGRAAPPRIVAEALRGSAPPAERRTRRGWWAVAPAVACVAFLVWAARWIPWPPQATPMVRDQASGGVYPRRVEAARPVDEARRDKPGGSPGQAVARAVQPPVPLPFVIEGRPGGFASLAEAVAAANDGAVVTVHGPGPYPMPPLAWRGRSLTLRAAPDGRACLEAAGPAADPWESLLTTDRDLTIEGLDLRAPAAGGAGGWLIRCERAGLRLTDCRLSSASGAGVVLRNGGALVLRGCRVETGGGAVSVEVGDQTICKVRIVETVLDVREPGGAAVALWAPAVRQPTAVDLELTGDAIRASRATALTGLPAGLHVTARGNDFIVRDSLLSCAGYAGLDGWKRGATWEGHDNRYHGPGAWLDIDGEAADVHGLAGWRGLWGDGETGSREDAAASAVPAAKVGG